MATLSGDTSAVVGGVLAGVTSCTAMADGIGTSIVLPRWPARAS
jgi:hypothetical protein